jgi:hypothetical protein
MKVTTVEATNQLRFLEKEGLGMSSMVLQQAWHIISRDGELVRGEVEWRDVPLVREQAGG